MTSHPLWMVLAITLVLALAGCAERTDDEQPPAGDDVPPTDDNNDDAPPTDDGAENYTLTTSGVPTTVAAGEAFNFTLKIDGPAGTTDHLGAHYGNASSDEPSTAVYDKACNHTEGTLPGEFTVSCTIAEPGTWHLRGHLRTGAGDDVRNWWGPDNTIAVTPAVVAAVATSIEILSVETEGGNATVCWQVAGTGTVPHTAIHWDNATHADAEEPNFTLYGDGASYPGNMTAADPEGYELAATGATFCTNMPLGGETLYVVAHVIDGAGGFGIISDEREVAAA